MRIFSYGGGWQSTAALVLASRGLLDFRTFVFANVGDDSEDPATLAYIEQYARPFAAVAGIELVTVQRTRRDGTPETLYGRLTREGSRSLPIPLYFSGGVPGGRSCTADFKIRVIGKWARHQGASETDPATVGIGISVDEIARANARRCEPHERIVYPLLDLGVRRADCPRIITSAGLPVPPKSSCWFCPFHRPSTWEDMRRDRPELFARACDLEELLNRRRDLLGRDHVYLTRFGRPLAEVTGVGQELLDFTEGECDSGYCFT